MDYGALKGAAGKVGLTHLALKCRDTKTTAAFYRDVCGMTVVHEREGDLQPVIWVSARPLGIDFVLVLMGGGDGSPAPRMDHLGFIVSTREHVDRVADAARALGILADGPVERGPPVGYYVIVLDPDGNGVEFSFDQDIAF